MLAAKECFALLGEPLPEFWVERPAFWCSIPSPAPFSRSRRLDFTLFQECVKVIRVDTISRTTAITHIERSQFSPPNPSKHLLGTHSQPSSNHGWRQVAILFIRHSKVLFVGQRTLYQSITSP